MEKASGENEAKEAADPSKPGKLNPQADMEEETTLCPSLTVSKPNDDQEMPSTSESKRSAILKADDYKALRENMSSITMELIEAMDSENGTSKATSPSKVPAKDEAMDSENGSSKATLPGKVPAKDDAMDSENGSSKVTSPSKVPTKDGAMDSKNGSSKATSPGKVPAKDEKELPAATSLSLIAQYNSDSDHDSNVDDADCEDNDIVEVPIVGAKNYRNKVIEIKSESESDSSSSEDLELEYMSKIRKEIEKTMDLEDDDDDGDDDGCGGDDGGKKKKKQNSQMRVKGELLLEDLPPIQDLHITVKEEECVELGRVESIVDQLLLVSVLPDSMLLDLDTVLFLDKGKKVLGEVFDVVGQVADPLYCVRFNSNKEIEEKGIKIGDKVYVAPKTPYTQIVVLSSLMKLRGSDASWENDVEPPPHHVDYSDDEQEREARSRLRNQDRPNDHQDPKKRARGNDNRAGTDDRPSTSQTRGPNRNERFNRDRNESSRPSYQSQRNRAQPNAVPHSGSWHSNYRQPFNPYPNAPMMLQSQANPMVPPYPMGYVPTPFRDEQVTPIAPPDPTRMFVLNPLSVNAPPMPRNLQSNMPQYYSFPQPDKRASTHSPPPPPPGLD